MIEVIKHGKTKFTATCAHCGCEFTYELSDLNNSILYCPDCGHRYCHYPILETGGLYYQSNCRRDEEKLFVGDISVDTSVLKMQPDWTYKENTVTGVYKE